MRELSLVHTQSDAEQMWRTLMSPLGFGGHTIWMVLIEHDRPIPHILEIVESAAIPSRAEVETLACFLTHLATPGTRVAFLRSRPGSGAPDAADRAWARVLYDACREADVPTEVVHLAHDHDVIPIPLDGLLAASA